MTAPLRLLMVIHTPWSRNLGASRVPLELGEEFQRLGDTVEKFSYEDAFPEAIKARGRGVLSTLLADIRGNRSFAARAEKFVRKHGSRFDIIDANQTDLRVSKSSLGFNGLLVARSVGLIPAYAEFERLARKRWREGTSVRNMAHRVLTFPRLTRRLRDVEKSFRHADLINVSNQDDLETVSTTMGYREKVAYFPFGLSQSRLDAFAACRPSTASRLTARTVAFIGMWNSRKGARDWPEIFARLRLLVPDARLLVLGAGLPIDHVLDEFSPDLRGAVTVVPAFESEELPRLLAPATVGAFPGYLEGFGFGVLEMLAAGLPTIAYDAPGSRDMLRPLTQSSLTPTGNPNAFALRLAEMLSLSDGGYAEYAEQSDAVARTFCWRDIALQTRATYIDRLARVRTR